MSGRDGFDGPGTLVGTLPVPADAPAELLDLLRTAAGPSTADETADEPAAVAAFVATRAELDAATSVVPAPRGRTHPARHSLRGAIAATISFLVLGGGLAAADVLPAPAQRWVSSTLDKIGISVPSPGSPQSVGTGTGTGTGLPGPTGLAGSGIAERPVAANFALPPGPPPGAPPSPADVRQGVASAEPEAASDAATAASPAPGASQRPPTRSGSSDENPTGRSTTSPAPGSGQSSNSSHASGGNAGGNSGGNDDNPSGTKPGKRGDNDKGTPRTSSQGASGRSAPDVAIRQGTPTGVTNPGKALQPHPGGSADKEAGRGPR